MTLEELQRASARFGFKPPETLDPERLARAESYATRIVVAISDFCHLPGHTALALAATFYDADIHMLTGDEMAELEQFKPTPHPDGHDL